MRDSGCQAAPERHSWTRRLRATGLWSPARVSSREMASAGRPCSRRVGGFIRPHGAERKAHTGRAPGLERGRARAWPFCFPGVARGGSASPSRRHWPRPPPFMLRSSPPPHPGLRFPQHAPLPSVLGNLRRLPLALPVPLGEPRCVGRGQASFSVHDTCSGRGAGRGLYLDGARLSYFLPSYLPKVI